MTLSGCWRAANLLNNNRIDYPRAPLDRAFALAEAVDKMGGEATAEIAAESMGNKVGGAFTALIGAAVKYGLISN